MGQNFNATGSKITNVSLDGVEQQKRVLGRSKLSVILKSIATRYKGLMARSNAEVGLFKENAQAHLPKDVSSTIQETNTHNEKIHTKLHLGVNIAIVSKATTHDVMESITDRTRYNDQSESTERLTVDTYTYDDFCAKLAAFHNGSQGDLGDCTVIVDKLIIHLSALDLKLFKRSMRALDVTIHAKSLRIIAKNDDHRYLRIFLDIFDDLHIITQNLTFEGGDYKRLTIPSIIKTLFVENCDIQMLSCYMGRLEVDENRPLNTEVRHLWYNRDSNSLSWSKDTPPCYQDRFLSLLFDENEIGCLGGESTAPITSSRNDNPEATFAIVGYSSRSEQAIDISSISRSTNGVKVLIKNSQFRHLNFSNLITRDNVPFYSLFAIMTC